MLLTVNELEKSYGTMCIVVLVFCTYYLISSDLLKKSAEHVHCQEAWRAQAHNDQKLFSFGLLDILANACHTTFHL